jgi:hypothetical protein
MQHAILALKALTALLQLGDRYYAWRGSPAHLFLSLRGTEAVTYSIFKDRVVALTRKFSRKGNGGSSSENSKLGNKSLPASRNAIRSQCLCLLPVTGN